MSLFKYEHQKRLFFKKEKKLDQNNKPTPRIFAHETEIGEWEKTSEYLWMVDIIQIQSSITIDTQRIDQLAYQIFTKKKKIINLR